MSANGKVKFVCEFDGKTTLLTVPFPMPVLLML